MTRPLVSIVTPVLNRVDRIGAALDSCRPGAVPIENSENSAANLISAVPQQLGLKLVPKDVTVDVLIIDGADKIPAEN